MSRENWGRGKVYQRGRTLWIRYPDGTGRQRRESAHTDDVEKARRLLERRIVETEDGKLPAKAKERKKSVNDLLDALERDYVARKCRSAHNLTFVLKRVRELLGDRRAARISTGDLTDYILARRKAGAAEETIGRELRHLGQAFRLQSAISIPKFPKLPKGKPRDVLIAPAEQRRLLAFITDECYRDATAFKFATGWRGDEIVTLQWRYVRQESGVIRLAEQYTKTGEPRDFPLAGEVAEIIRLREQERQPHILHVFHHAGRPIHYSNWRRAWQRAACQAGLGSLDSKGHYKDVNLHDSRRAFITDGVDSGLDPQVVRTLSGHKTNSVFERYRIVKIETLSRAIERRERYVERRATEQKIVVLAERRGDQNVAQMLANPNLGERKRQ